MTARLFLVLLLGAALGLGACGDDDDEPATVETQATAPVTQPPPETSTQPPRTIETERPAEAGDCQPLAIGNGRRAVEIEVRGVGCDIASRVIRDSRDRPEPDYRSQGFACLGRLQDEVDDSGVPGVEYRCLRGGDRITFATR